MAESTVAARWAVVDVSNDTVPGRVRHERVTATFRTWIGAQWMRWRWVQRHKREHCWPGCSTLWHYEVRPTSTIPVPLPDGSGLEQSTYKWPQTTAPQTTDSHMEGSQ